MGTNTTHQTQTQQIWPKAQEIRAPSDDDDRQNKTTTRRSGHQMTHLGTKRWHNGSGHETMTKTIWARTQCGDYCLNERTT